MVLNLVDYPLIRLFGCLFIRSFACLFRNTHMRAPPKRTHTHTHTTTHTRHQGVMLAAFGWPAQVACTILIFIITFLTPAAYLILLRGEPRVALQGGWGKWVCR